MPSILITTSRRTSNRVRAFARDLSTVLPGSLRFNRGGMSLKELVSRISQEDAEVAFVITTFRGNPGFIQIVSSDGSIHYEIRTESAVLRREVLADIKLRISELITIAILNESSEETNHFSQYLASLLAIPLTRIEKIEDIPKGRKKEQILTRFLTNSLRKVWTQIGSWAAASPGIATDALTGTMGRTRRMIWRMARPAGGCAGATRETR